MECDTERGRRILRQKIEAIENGYMREKISKRIFRTKEIRKFVREAKLALVYGGLYVDGYIAQIKAWKVEFIQEQACYCCGPCVECLGTGKTLLLIAEKYVCIACKGSGIRSQEFENLDYAEVLRDDLNLHKSEILDFQQYNEVYEGLDEYLPHELGFEVYLYLGVYHEEFEYDSDWDKEKIREQYMLFVNR
jgi:hypothetical protein